MIKGYPAASLSIIPTPIKLATYDIFYLVFVFL